MNMPVFNPSNMERAVPANSPKARISVVGLGYVGAVSTACLAALGHEVIGVDIDRAKTGQIARGESPIHEAGLAERLTAGVVEDRISTTSDLSAAVWESDVTFVSVGTPTAEDGGCDYSFIEQAAKDMGEGLLQKDRFHVFAMRCSIPPGTTMKIMAKIIEEISGKTAGQDFGICFNPEFLREGTAIEDFYNPPKTVIGTTDIRTSEIMRRIYAPVDANPIVTTIEVAETIKYVDNVWHATKVCFANEVGRLCKPLGVDSHAVMDIFVQDEKLNLSPYYLKPGFAYGGSCLPKEVRAVQHIAEHLGVSVPLIESLSKTNEEQIADALKMVRETGAKKVGVLGLAFKPGTDDLRESPILEVMAALREDGIELIAHDDAVTKDTPVSGLKSYVKHGSKGLSKLADALKGMLREDPMHVVAEADTLIVCHSSDTYRQVISRTIGKPVIDVVRLFRDPSQNAQVTGIGW